MALVRAAVTTLTHGPLRATTNYLSRPIRSTLNRSKSRLTRSLMRSPTRKGLSIPLRVSWAAAQTHYVTPCPWTWTASMTCLCASRRVSR